MASTTKTREGGVMLAAKAFTQLRGVRVKFDGAKRTWRTVLPDERSLLRLLAVEGEVARRSHRVLKNVRTRPARKPHRTPSGLRGEEFGAEFTPELREQEERLRRQIEQQQKRPNLNLTLASRPSRPAFFCHPSGAWRSRGTRP